MPAAGFTKVATLAVTVFCCCLVGCVAAGVGHSKMAVSVDDSNGQVLVNLALPPGSSSSSTPTNPNVTFILDGTWLWGGRVREWTACTDFDTCSLTLSTSPGRHTLASYVGLTLINATDVTVPSPPSSSSSSATAWSHSTGQPTVSPPAPSAPMKRPFQFGTYYTTIDVVIAQAYQRATAKRGGVPALTVEDVIRSNGKYNLSDCLKPYGEGCASLYQGTPAVTGYSCLFRASPRAPGYSSCPNITATLTEHAAQLTSTGVDYLLLDGTNLGGNDTQQYLLQQGPAEVIVEEFTALRKAGTATPDFAVWNEIRSGAVAWQEYLTHLYNNDSVNGVLYKSPLDGKYVFWTTAGAAGQPDPTILAQIKSNGGRNNMEVQTMWADLSKDEYAAGLWTFFARCLDPVSGEFTSDVPNVNTSTCGQLETTNSVLGTQMSLNHAFQTGYSSLPGQSAGKRGGLTLRSQFNQILKFKPDHIFTSSFNEHVAGPQKNPFANPLARSVGLEWTSGARSLWVDCFGVDRSRAWQPTVQGGNRDFLLQQSCIRVAALAYTNGFSTCKVAGEVCCEGTPEQVWTQVWALADAHSPDTLLTNSNSERNELVASKAWTEVCNGFGGPAAASGSCVDSQLPAGSSRDLVEGPFFLYAGSGVPNTMPLYRCRDASSGYHFFSPRQDCEGQVTESTLGYLSTTRTSATPRSIRRCRDPATGSWTHGLDSGSCAPGMTEEGVYGYVM